MECMANKGYIKLNRKLMNNWMYQDKPFNKSMAWIDLIMLADYETHTSMWRGQPTEFRRGDVNLSLSALATRWGWSRDKVRRFIRTLENTGSVTLNATRDKTTITLVKYDNFQIGNTRDNTSDKATDNTTDKATDNTYLKNKYKNKHKNKYEEEKEEIELLIPPIQIPQYGSAISEEDLREEMERLKNDARHVSI